jgi:AbrB family looped-hinge helix DNA binding protein
MTPTHVSAKVWTCKMGPKGHVVIPKQIRDRLNLKPGDRVLLREWDGGVYVRKAVPGPEERRANVAKSRGALAGEPAP